jgi:hypothetical protein
MSAAKVAVVAIFGISWLALEAMPFTRGTTAISRAANRELVVVRVVGVPILRGG